MTPSPTLVGFQSFIRTVMGIKPVDLPTNSPFIPMALAVSMSIVNPALRSMPLVQFDAVQVSLNTFGVNTIYDLAVYNLAGSNLLNYAQDQPGQNFFEALRAKLNIAGFVSGVVQGSGDEGTSVSLVVQEAAKAFTLSDLQNLKDPWGRRYLELAQSYGPATWGLT